MFNRRSLIGIAFASSAIAAMPVLAQDQATVGIQTQTSYSIDGRIAAVDNVSLIVEDTRTFVLSGPNVRTPQAGSATVGAAVAAGQNVAGAAVSQSITNWWVTAVNPAGNRITLVSPNSGPVRTYNVTNPASQQQLSRVKPGDSLTDINSRIAVVSITPRS